MASDSILKLLFSSVGTRESQAKTRAIFQATPPTPQAKIISTESGTRMMAYASLGSTGRRKYSSTLRTGKNPVVHNLLEDPTVLSVAERRSKTPAQIILRYLVQLGMVVIPKSSKRDRIVENFSIFDFVLDPEDMAALGGLDKVRIGRTGYFG